MLTKLARQRQQSLLQSDDNGSGHFSCPLYLRRLNLESMLRWYINQYGPVTPTRGGYNVQADKIVF